MSARLERYKELIDVGFCEMLSWNTDYSIEHRSQKLRTAIKSGCFKRIVFCGMGCSAIVSDIFKSFMTHIKAPIYIEVLNDYEVEELLDINLLRDGSTLVIITSYSGCSIEPVKCYRRVKKYTKNIVFLTSGGNLAAIAQKEHVAVIYWKLRKTDREYPLFSAPQYFSILCDIFYKLGILPSNFVKQIQGAQKYLKRTFTHKKVAEAEKIAMRLRNRYTVSLASARNFLLYLKLFDMHFNEIAMAPVHRNTLHEFTHSEVAVFSDPHVKLGILLFRDKDEDVYTKQKMDRLIKIMSDKKDKANRNIEMLEVLIPKGNFFERFFSTLLFVHYIVYFLGTYYHTKSRELISTCSGNTWYNKKTIKKEARKR
jgi:glucose/mannose-6-phosphate isomerase